MKLNVCLIITFVAIFESASIGARFQSFGDLPGRGRLDISDMSADGRVVVGGVNSDRLSGPDVIVPFRWSTDDGLTVLEDVHSAASGHSVANGVSADGSVVVGGGIFDDLGDAFLWTVNTGVRRLGGTARGWTLAYDVSDDESVVVGISGFDGPETEAVRWTEQEGWMGLGDLPGGAFQSRAFGVSADGSAIVGFATRDRGREAFVWSEASGIQGLGHLPGGATPSPGGGISSAAAVSANGAVVVGISNSAAGPQAFRWTHETGMVGLTDSDPTVVRSNAFDVSGDGSTVIGYAERGTGLDAVGRAFIWDERHGMRDLQDVLVSNYGLDLTGWTLVFANAISADGKTIAGLGVNPQGENANWITTIPEPSCLAIMRITGAMTVVPPLLRKRRSSRERIC